MIYYDLMLKVNEHLGVLTALSDEMLETVKAIVKKNGGTVDMSGTEVDCAYAVECLEGKSMVETQIVELKVENEVLYYRTELNGTEWRNLRYSENYFLPTLFSVVENIFNYIEQIDDRDDNH